MTELDRLLEETKRLAGIFRSRQDYEECETLQKSLKSQIESKLAQAERLIPLERHMHDQHSCGTLELQTEKYIQKLQQELSQLREFCQHRLLLNPVENCNCWICKLKRENQQLRPIVQKVRELINERGNEVGWSQEQLIFDIKKSLASSEVKP